MRDFSSKINQTPIQVPVATKQQQTVGKVSTINRGSTGVRPRKEGSRPIASLQLERILGYRGFDTFQSCLYANDAKSIVYPAAAVVVIMDANVPRKQTFYTGHTDDVISIAVSTQPKYKTCIATGQVGEEAEIHVWNLETKKPLTMLKGAHKSGITYLNYSASGKYLLSVGLDNSIAIWRWQEATLISKSTLDVRIFQAQFRPDSDTNFVTVGKMHVRFWQVAGNALIDKRPILDNSHSMKTMLSIAFAPEHTTYTGSAHGDIYVWKETKLQRVVANAHNGPLFTMFTTLRDGLIVTGAKNAPQIKLWDQELKRSKEFQLPVPKTTLDEGSATKLLCKSLCRASGKVLVGTKQNIIFEVNDKTSQWETLVEGHAEGEVWGLAIKGNHVATGGIDKTLRLWNLETFKQDAKVITNQGVKCVAIGANADLVALGMHNGEVQLLSRAQMKPLAQRRDQSASVSQVKFAGSQYLVVLAGNTISVLQATDLERVAITTLQCNEIGHVDVSQDGKIIRVMADDFRDYLFELPKLGKATLRNDINWTEVTVPVGEDVNGIWPENAKSGDINALCRSHGELNVATGDDFGCVKLFPYPCGRNEDLNSIEPTRFFGHSAHVTNVAFTDDDRYLISTGGDDCCVFVWRCLSEDELDQ